MALNSWSSCFHPQGLRLLEVTFVFDLFSLWAPASVWQGLWQLACTPKCCAYWHVPLTTTKHAVYFLEVIHPFNYMTIFDGKKVCHYQVIYSKYETIRKFHVAHIKCKSNRRMRTMITIYIIKYVPYILRSLKSQHSNLCIEFSKYPTITLTGQ